MKSLRIGCVKYLNARPLVRGWQGKVNFDHPSALCNELAAGKLDVALVSSFEFLRNPIYRIINDVSVSSNGPVYSVIVAHRGKIDEIKQIELDPASETSTNLLRCLLMELRLNPRLISGSGDCQLAVADTLAATGNARLLIGDQAIQFRQKYTPEFSFWDLGEQWKKLFNLPFVYALWLIRPEVGEATQIANLLRGVRDANVANLDDLVAEVLTRVADNRKWSGVDREFLSRYYTEHLQFGFGEREKEGLRIFANLCTNHGLLPRPDVALQVV